MSSNKEKITKTYEKMIINIKEKLSKKSDSLSFDYSKNMIKPQKHIDDYFPNVSPVKNINKTKIKKINFKIQKLLKMISKLLIFKIYFQKKDNYCSEEYIKMKLKQQKNLINY